MNKEELKLAQAIGIILGIIFLVVFIAALFVPNAFGQLSGEYEDEGCEVEELYGSRTFLPIRLLLIHDPGVSSLETLDTDKPDTRIEFREREDVMEITTNSTDRIVMKYSIEYQDPDTRLQHPFEVRLESANDIVSQVRTFHTTSTGTYCRIITMITAEAPQPETLEDLLGKDAVQALIDISDIGKDIEQILQALAFGQLSDTGIMIGILLLVAGVIIITYFGRNEFKDLMDSMTAEKDEQTEFNENSKTIMDDVILKVEDKQREQEEKFNILIKKGDEMVEKVTSTVEGAFQVQKSLPKKPEKKHPIETQMEKIQEAEDNAKSESSLGKITKSLPKILTKKSKKKDETKKDIPENLTENYWMIFFYEKKYSDKKLRQFFNDNRSLYIQSKYKNQEAFVKANAIANLLRGKEPE